MTTRAAPARHALERVETAVALVERVVAVGLLVMVLSATFAQVVARFVFDSPFFWSEELSRYGYVWLVFVASVFVMGERTHLTVEFGDRRLGRRGRFAVNLFGIVACVVACAVLAIGSLGPLADMSRGSSPALGIPTVVFYGVVLVSIALMGVHALANVVRLVLAYRAHTEDELATPTFLEGAV